MGTRTESGAPAIRPGGARIIGDLHSDHSGPGPDVMAAQTLQGNAVVNALGEDLGHIEQIMLDVRRGQIAYAVLSFGAALSMGDKLFAVPWSALIMDTDRECFVLDILKERLQSAPGFDQHHWPSMADPAWQSEINRYYGTRSYWD